MESTFNLSLTRFRASILNPEAMCDKPVLSLAELDALCSPTPENVDEVILLCLLAARQYPVGSASLSHVPWILSAMAINYPDRLAPYIHAVAELLQAPSEQIREHAAHLVGDWWQRGNRDLFAYLIRALRDPSPVVVRAALVRLRQSTASQALEILEHCGRVLEATDFPDDPEEFQPCRPEWKICAYFAQMALLLARQGLVNEIALRQFFGHLKSPAARTALAPPVREWLSKPTGAMDELLAKYTQQELADFE